MSLHQGPAPANYIQQRPRKNHSKEYKVYTLYLGNIDLGFGGVGVLGVEIIVGFLGGFGGYLGVPVIIITGIAGIAGKLRYSGWGVKYPPPEGYPNPRCKNNGFHRC